MFRPYCCSPYMYWSKDVKTEHVTNDELAEIIKRLESLGYHAIPYTTIKAHFYHDNGFALKKNGKYLDLYCYYDVNLLPDDEEYLAGYHHYTTHAKDDKKNINYAAGYSGRDAFRAVSDRFVERTGKTIREAFGTSIEEFKTCIPKQFYFTNPLLINKTKIMSSCDFCSQYPSNLCGLLPDAHDSKKVYGIAEPNEEYPFAFYLKSGHCAQYNVFDTRNWNNSLFSYYLFGMKESWNGNKNIKPDEEVTILMKASKYSFDEEMKYYYSQRHDNPLAKLVMNAFIGFLHKNNYRSNKQAHIAAIVIARANNKMLNLAEKIGIENVVHIAVDGIIYLGTDVYGTSVKALNELNQEVVGAKTMVIGANSYVMEKDGKVVKFKHGAYNARYDGVDIETCNSIRDMKQWYREQTKLEKVLYELKGE